MDLTLLDRRVTAESLADRLRQRLGTIDDEEAADGGNEPTADQAFQQWLQGARLSFELGGGNLRTKVERYPARGAVSKFLHREEKALLCRLLNREAGPLSAIC